jgi:glyoxylase-like metal-dependent hydrolase (beta-lactamase superfamily II)
MVNVSVHALSAGSLTIPEKFFVVPSDPDIKFTVPSLSFLIQHTSSSTNKTTRIIFDLGLRRDTKLYPDALQAHIVSRQPMTTQPDIVTSLRADGRLNTADIDYVILSHVHYDHVGYPADFSSPHTNFIVGPGAPALLSGETQLNVGSHSHFEADLLPLDRTIELPPAHLSTVKETENPSASSAPPPKSWQWRPLKPFPSTMDLFGDGSVRIVNAPGHLPGHINLLCRIAPGKYVYLAGDAAHDSRLFAGTHDIATWTDDTGRACCIHADREATLRTLGWIREIIEGGLVEEGGGDNATVEVIFAHDWAWEKDARKRGRFWPGSL